MDIKIDKITRSKRKTLSIIIRRDGRVEVRAPRFAQDHEIQRFVQSKKKWIINKKEQILTQQPLQHNYHQGEIFLFLGKQYPLDLVNSRRYPLVLDGKFLLDKKLQISAEKVFTNWYREKSREIFTDRVLTLSRQHNYQFSKIRISSALTRWGSCSSTGTLSFTWRLIMAPIEVIDYVILHELIHTRIKNHSSAFWKRVEELDPDYKMKRTWLRNNGYKLNI